MRRVSSLIATGALAGTAAVAAWPATPRRPITERSDGKTLRLAKGGTATLRLSNRWRWSEPRVSTKTVELTPVAYFADPGFREWTIEARQRGRATIRATGERSCSTCAHTTQSFQLDVVVGHPAGSK